MIKTKALSSAAVLGMVAMLFAGCGDGDNTKSQVCQPSESTCLSDGNAGQVCSADGTTFVDFECKDDETCSDGACVARCDVGDVTCAGKSVSRVCTDEGDRWEPVPCPVGTACVEGDGCVPSDEGVTICTPDETVCANKTTVKTCDSDGSGWVYTSCGANESCNDGECEFDEDIKCAPRDKACVDSETSATCKDDGSGWTITDCPEGISCSDGACRGSGCVVGETRCEEPSPANIYYGLTFRTLYTCVDGVNWEATQCGAGEICTYDNITQPEIDSWVRELEDWYTASYYGSPPPFPTAPDTSDSVASCKAPECDAPAAYYGLLDNVGYFDINFYGGLDIAQCGDVTSGGNRFASDSYSTCVGLPPYSNLTWSVTDCQEPAFCTYKVTAGTYTYSYLPTCATTCVPGETACSSSDAIVTCDENGQWGAPEECPMIDYEGEEGYQGYCVPKNPGGPTVGTTGAQCMDPACAYWEFYGSNLNFYGLFEVDEVGACTQDGQFRACNSKGMLEDAEECSTGLCQNYGYTFSNAAGQSPGLCLPSCLEGTSRCYPTGQAVQTCVDGEWSAELDVCDTGESCYYSTGNFGMTTATCGECQPGDSYCSDGLLYTCNSKGELKETECSYGTCVDSGAFAHCEVECVDDAAVCDSDGSSTYQKCVDGKYVSSNCDAGTSCRVNYSGKSLGCLECVGPGLGGNYYYNTADAYCTTEGEVVTCGNNNKYGDPVDCTNGCVGTYTTDTPVNAETIATCSSSAPANL